MCVYLWEWRIFIFEEIMERRPLFKSPIEDKQEDTQLAQLALVTQTCGTPTDRTWIGTGRCR
jgi:hypothetical protein